MIPSLATDVLIRCSDCYIVGGVIQSTDILCDSSCMVFFTCYRYPNHEEAIGELAREMGFSHVSLSSQVMPMVRMVPRGYTGY